MQKKSEKFHERKITRYFQKTWLHYFFKLDETLSSCKIFETFYAVKKIRKIKQTNHQTDKQSNGQTDKQMGYFRGPLFPRSRKLKPIKYFRKKLPILDNLQGSEYAPEIISSFLISLIW